MQDLAAPRLWQVTCQCGWRTRGTKEVIVPAVQEHGLQTHGISATEDEVMALAVPAPEAPNQTSS